MAATATKKAPNYSDADVERLKALYAEHGNDGMADIAAEMNKTVRSVRAKLVREGVYVAPEKPVAAKKEGPSKKELLATLAEVKPGVPVDGLMGATKEAIAFLIAEFAPAADA